MRVPTRILPTMSALALLTLAAACGAENGGAGLTPPAESDLLVTTNPAGGPVDRVNWMLTAEPVTLDPDLDSGNNEDSVTGNVCERLFQTQPDLSVKPHLAESVDRPDPKTIVYTLRDDVTFHDGSPMTAADVLWSLERHARDGGDESDEFESVESIEATGDHEVTIRLSAPDALFDMRMAGNGGIVYNPRAVEAAGDDFGSPQSGDACSGPYEVTEWQAGSRLTISRYEDYWDDSVDARAGSVTFRWADGSALVNALSSNDAQGVFLSEPSAASPLAKNDAVGTYYGATTTSWQLFPTTKGALTDPRIRTALSLAIDREGIAKAAFAGGAEPWRLPVGPGSWGYERAAFEKAYDEVDVAPESPTEDDLNRAEELVAEVGDPGTIVVGSDGSPVNTVIANAVRSAAQRIGLEVEITTMSEAQWGELFSSEEARQKVDVFITDWYLSKPDPIGMYDNLLSDSVNNYIGFKDAEYDEVVSRAIGEYDEPTRAELAIQAQEIWMENMLTIPLVMSPNTLVLSKELTGVPVAVAYLSYPWAADLGKS